MRVRTVRRRGSPLLLLFLVAGSLQAQFTDLTAPGNGGDLYYSLAQGPGPVYRIGSVPATLYASFPPPVFPPPPAMYTNPYYLSPYYLTSHPQFSRDGSVFAFTATRICLGGIGCTNQAQYRTTVQADSPQAAQSFPGFGWLSGNGRYLFTFDAPILLAGTQPVLTDLATGKQQIGPVECGLYYLTNASGRVVADDGTAVCGGGGAIYIVRDGQVFQATPNTYTSNATEPVIDAAARTILYTYIPSTGPRSLRAYDVATAGDRFFVQPNGDTYAPSISADGKRVMFLSAAQWGTSNPPGVIQLYAANLDGTGFQELTSGAEPSGVQTYTMSDDGQVAWYLSGDDKLVKLELAGGQSVRRVFQPLAVDLSTTLVPGSIATLHGVGLTTARATQFPPPTTLGGVRVTLNGLAVPLLSVSPTSIDFQVPWETQAGQSATLQVVAYAGTPAESSAQATVSPVVSSPSLLTCTQPGCWPAQGGAAIHEDWSAFVSVSRPALAGEILHFYGTGFGPVQTPVGTAIVSPANPPAALSTLPSCTVSPGDLGPVTVLWAGLAPGLIGYYQIDVRLPAKTIPVGSFLYPTVYPIINITCGPGIAADFAVGPNPPPQ